MPSRKPVVEIKNDSVSATKPKKKNMSPIEEVEDSEDETQTESSEEEKVSKPISKPKASIKKNVHVPKKKELIKKSQPIVKSKAINKVEEENQLGSESDDEVKVPRSKPVSIPKKEVIKPQKKEIPKKEVSKPIKKKVVESDSDDNKHPTSTVTKSHTAKPNRWRDHVKKIQNQHKSMLYKDVLKLAAESYSKEN